MINVFNVHGYDPLTLHFVKSSLRAEVIMSAVYEHHYSLAELLRAAEKMIESVPVRLAPTPKSSPDDHAHATVGGHTIVA